MLADSTGPLPQSHLSGASLPELISRAQRVRDTTTLLIERGQLVVEFRRRELSWRQIEQQTGWPQSSARRWFRQYLATL
jgi:hypothetical protein